MGSAGSAYALQGALPALQVALQGIYMLCMGSEGSAYALQGALLALHVALQG